MLYILESSCSYQSSFAKSYWEINLCFNFILPWGTALHYPATTSQNSYIWGLTWP